MTEIKILYDRIYSDTTTKDPRQFIDLYDENKAVIEGADSSISNPDYDGIMRLTSDYALSLSHYGSSKKAILYLDKSIQQFKDSTCADLRKVSMYEMLVWTRGVEQYNNKRYKTASKDFQYLVDNYPENDKYRNWLLASKTITAKKWLNILWYSAIATLVWETMVNKEDATFKNYLLITSFILFILAILTEILNAFIKSSIKLK